MSFVLFCGQASQALAQQEGKPITSAEQIQSEDDLSKLVDALGASAGISAAPVEATPSLGAVMAEMVPATVAPGGKFELVVHVAVKPGVHAYPDEAQNAEGPSSIYFSCADGSCGPLLFSPPMWPKAVKVKNILGEMEAVYQGEVLIRFSGVAPAKAGTYTAKGAFKGRYCDDAGSCYPPRDYPWEAQLRVAEPAKESVQASPAAAAASATSAAKEPEPRPAAPTDLAVAAQAAPDRVAPGGAFELRVRVTPPTGLHTYPEPAQNPDSTSELKVEPLSGVAFGRPSWPKAQTWESKIRREREQVYLGETVLRVTAVADKALAPGVHTVRGTFKGQTCNDNTCFALKDYPWEASFTVDPAATAVAPASSGGQLDRIPFDLPWGRVVIDPNTVSGLLAVLVLAGLGGFILNFMPCVLPVIPIKILGLAQAAGSPGRRLFLGGMMSAGVVALWLAMGGILAFSRVLGGTADLFSYPAVNLGLGLFIVLMAFAATGFVPVRLPQAVYRVNPRHDSPIGSFGFGVMTGVFALPCIGPFMGGAAAAALQSGSAAFTLAVFVAVGVGMALPYLVLAANPKWVDKLPKAGPGSDVMKTFLGWLMLAGGAYFIQAAVVQWMRPETHFGKRAGVMVVLALLAVAGGALAFGCAKLLRQRRQQAPTGGSRPSSLMPAVFLAFGLAVAAFGGWQVYEEVATRPFPFLRLESEAQLTLGDGKVTVVDFRSTNCLNCDYNEKTVFNTAEGKAILGADGVAAYQANIDDAPAREFLKKVSGNVAVPYLVVYDAEGRPVEKLPALLTLDQLRQAVEKARGSK